MADAGLGHDRDRDRGLDALDHLRVAHAGHATVAADVGRHPLERHDRDGAGVFGDLGLLGRDDVHDDAALQHLGQAPLDAEGAGLARTLRSSVVGHERQSRGRGGPDRQVRNQLGRTASELTGPAGSTRAAPAALAGGSATQVRPASG